MNLATCRALFDDAYVTGGESITAANLGLHHIVALWAMPDTVTCAGYDIGWDKTNGKLFVTGFEDTITIAADTLTDTLDASPAEDVLTIYNAAQTTTLTLEEVDGTWTDLSAVRVRIFAIGW